MPGVGSKAGLHAAPRRPLGRAVALALALATAVEGSACAMRAADQKTVECSLEGSSKLGAELRGESAVCAPLVRALSEAAAQAGIASNSVKLTVRALSADRITVTTSVAGKALPALERRSADRPLGRSAIERLARDAASQLRQFAASERR